MRRLRVAGVERGTQTEEEVIEVPRTRMTPVAKSSSSTSGIPSKRSSSLRRRHGNGRSSEGAGHEERQPAAEENPTRSVELESEDARLNARWRQELWVMELVLQREQRPETEPVEAYLRLGPSRSSPVSHAPDRTCTLSSELVLLGRFQGTGGCRASIHLARAMIAPLGFSVALPASSLGSP